MPGNRNRHQRRRSVGVTPLGGIEDGEDPSARSILSHRHEDNTLRGYGGKIRRVSLFLLSKEEFHCALDPDSNLVDPAKVTFRILSAIFGELGSNPDYASVQSRRRAAELNRDRDNDRSIPEESENPTESDPLAEGRDRVTMAISTMQGYKSAIVNYFEKCKVVWTGEFDIYVEQLIDGYGKLIAEKKERGVMAMQEGKNHLQFGAYQELAKYMMSVGPPDNERQQRRLAQIDRNRAEDPV